ncbi:histidine kinase-, DNA gyrase B-, and HSP90-like ATPase family protein [Orientia chuto str. Dubai]|uniref:histidine kinase n=1 Tax=Orientia chuto str. Dubai TaxID=1359168 RepID=A0A0F3MGL9_9RICK|nr:ATP-binding protein [Candidatus Orientia mediorientalis]KJV54612.1 histidine kinase-, DNA gyrase B-, and HSP90-like ATPase family protein [Orientia chuto str. Dubai]
MKNEKYQKNVQLLLQYLVEGDFPNLTKQILRLKLSVIGLFKIIQKESLDCKIIKSTLYKLIREYQMLFLSTSHEKIYLNNLLEKAIADVRNNESKFSVTTDYDYEKICMIGYRHEIQQILTQLLDNANKFGKEDKKVLIKVELLNPEIQDKTLQLTIHDNGKGVEEKINSAIKDWNQDNILGLGLTFVKLILQEIKGEITYNSHRSYIRVPIYAQYLSIFNH